MKHCILKCLWRKQMYGDESEPQRTPRWLLLISISMIFVNCHRLPPLVQVDPSQQMVLFIASPVFAVPHHDLRLQICRLLLWSLTTCTTCTMWQGLDPSSFECQEARMIVAVLPTWLHLWIKSEWKFWKYLWNPLSFSTLKTTRPHPLGCEDHAFWWPKARHWINWWCQVTSPPGGDPNTCHATDAAGLSRPQAVVQTGQPGSHVSPRHIKVRTVAYSTAELLPRPRNEKKYEAYVNQIVGYLSAIEYLLIKIITNPRRTQQQSDNLSLKFVEKKEHWTKPIVRKCTFTAHFSNSHAIEQVCPPLSTCLAHDVGMPALCSIDICSIEKYQSKERTTVHRNAQAFESKLPQVEWASSCPSQTKSGFRVPSIPTTPPPPPPPPVQGLLLIFLSSSKARASRTTCILQDTSRERWASPTSVSL